MAKRFCGKSFALVQGATQFSSSALTVIADTAIAASPAANKPAGSSDGPPTGATNGAQNEGSIIVIASGRTGAACLKRNHA